jgi:AcrR family transcriptional regulator
VARPRTVSDEAIIEAAYQLVVSNGPKGLTFKRLGEEVNLVPAALARRFTSKQALLLEVDRFAFARSNARLQEVRNQAGSPIEAILASFIAELSFVTTIERFIHGEEYLLMDLGDRDMYANYHLSFHERHRQVAELLREAQQRGEIDAAIDVNEFAQFLQMILHGAGHVWAMDQKAPIEKYITKYVQLALQPYKGNKGRKSYGSRS